MRELRHADADQDPNIPYKLPYKLHDHSMIRHLLVQIAGCMGQFTSYSFLPRHGTCQIA